MFYWGAIGIPPGARVGIGATGGCGIIVGYGACGILC